METHQRNLKIFSDSIVAQIKGFDWQFNTFDQEPLQAMLRAIQTYCYHYMMHKVSPMNHKPYWLTLIGESETGKTHLASRLFNFFETHIQGMLIPVYGAEKWQHTGSTGKFEMSSRIGEKALAKYDYLKTLNDSNLLVIDELDPRVSASERDKVSKLLSWRASDGVHPWSWTIITSNLTRAQIGEQFDKRIESRVRRDDNVIIEIKGVKPFFDRQ